MKRYGCFSFLFDCFMVLITGGLWFIWIFIRERRRRRYRQANQWFSSIDTGSVTPSPATTPTHMTTPAPRSESTPNLEASSQTASEAAIQEQTSVVTCRSCGANSRVSVGQSVNCEYCGSPLR